MSKEHSPSHPPIFLEPEEEVVSLIGRLRHLPAGEYRVVVPENALILSSALTLKILAREAQRTGKRLIIVTPEGAGAEAAREAGFSVQTQLHDLPPSPISSPSPVLSGSSASPSHKKESSVQGSTSSWEHSSPPRHQKKASLPVDTHPPVSRRSKGIGGVLPPERSSSRISLKERKNLSLGARNKPLKSQKISFQKERQKKGGAQDPHNERKWPWRYMVGGIAVGGILFFLFSLWVIARQEVEVAVTPSSESFSEEKIVSFSLAGQEEKNFPWEEVVIQETFRKEFRATGKAPARKGYARGVVTIYNFYSEEEQPLVATTRLLTPDGKLFRLEESVVVPGFTKDEKGNVVPGKVEARVKADKPGSQYNLSAGTAFTIPGFQGSPKYQKFTAENTKPFVGGSDESEGTVTVVSREDIQKAEEEVRQLFLQRLEEERAKKGDGWKIAPGSETFLQEKGYASPSEGTTTTIFRFSLEGTLRALIFHEESLKNFLTTSSLQEKEDGLQKKGAWKWEITDLSFQKGTYSSDGKSFTLPASFILKGKANVDTQALRQSLAGKDMQSIKELVEQSTSLQEIHVSFPSFSLFRKKLPSRPERIRIIVR